MFKGLILTFRYFVVAKNIGCSNPKKNCNEKNHVFFNFLRKGSGWRRKKHSKIVFSFYRTIVPPFLSHCASFSDICNLKCSCDLFNTFSFLIINIFRNISSIVPFLEEIFRYLFFRSLNECGFQYLKTFASQKKSFLNIQ